MLVSSIVAVAIIFLFFALILCFFVIERFKNEVELGLWIANVVDFVAATERFLA